MDPQTQSSSQFDFAAHCRSATDSFQRIRPIYESFCQTVRGILIEALTRSSLKTASVEVRAKSLDSFSAKASEPKEGAPDLPKYSNPIAQITDLAGARIITFFLDSLPQIDQVILNELDVVEKIDKGALLLEQEKLGYHSVHYVAKLKVNRISLPEYARFKDLLIEIQVRTVLQHAWAEIEHDIQYKSIETIPTLIRRRLIALAGLLEIADREFQAVQIQDMNVRSLARSSVREGRLTDVEITGDALKAYLDKRLGPDGRVTESSYEWTAKTLRHFGFVNFKQVDECIDGRDGDKLSRVAWGAKQGQVTRFELMLLASMGQSFIDMHRWGKEDWWRTWISERLNRLRSGGIDIGSYLPSINK